MRLVLFALPLAVLLGYALGGRLRVLGGVRLRQGWAGLAGVALQFLPLSGTAGFLALMASFALLMFVAIANVRLPGFALVTVGLCMNFLVIAVNQGMPVTRQALMASGQADTLEELRAGAGSKHHLATDDDHLLFLADGIGIPAPLSQAVSVGDIVAYAGATWFVVAGMRRRDEDARADAAPVGIPT